MGARSAMAATEPMAAARRTIYVEGPEGPPLAVVSDMDARLEAAQMAPECQVWFGAVTDDIITLEQGDVVIDVGANIGSFSRLAARVVGSKGRVYAVEPLPEVYQALEENCHSFQAHYAAQPERERPANIVPVHAGIVPEPNSGTADFVFFPKCAALSTQAEHRDDADALNCTASIVVCGTAPSTTTLQHVAKTVARAVPWVYKPLHVAVSKPLLLGGARLVPCPVQSLSHLLDTCGIKRVDLIKINVERGELGVLRSVRQERWPRIKQVSMQLHDRDGALDAALALLQETAGFNRIGVYKEPRFRDCCLVQVYAVRKEEPVLKQVIYDGLPYTTLD